MVTSRDSPCAFRFIFRNEATGKFAVDPTALETLRGMPCPVAVVGMCGAARLGKSTLLNMLLREVSGDDSLQGFAVSDSTAYCTQGLWLCASPPLASLAPINGVAPRVLFLDTEGVDAEDQDEEYMCQLFALTVLLSSVFLLNTHCTADEACLGRLSFLTAIATSIRAEVFSGHPARSQALLWVLRDFYHELGETTPDEYLESKVKDAPTVKASRAHWTEEMNRVRASIRSLFPRRCCFPLVRPVLEESDLRHLDTLPQSELRPKFMHQFQDLAGAVVQQARPTVVGSTVLTGTLLAQVSEAFVSAMNDGGIPMMCSVWESNIVTICDNALKAAKLQYDSMIGISAASQEPQLYAVHVKASRAALGSFDRAVSGLGVSAQEPRKRLLDFFGKRFLLLRRLHSWLRKQETAEEESASYRVLKFIWAALCCFLVTLFTVGLAELKAQDSARSMCDASAWEELIIPPSLFVGGVGGALAVIFLYLFSLFFLEWLRKSSVAKVAGNAAKGTGAAGAAAGTPADADADGSAGADAGAGGSPGADTGAGVGGTVL